MARHLDGEALGVVSGGQSHGARVLRVSLCDLPTTPAASGEPLPHRAFEGTDAFFTSDRHLCLAVYTADCVPVVLADAAQGYVGVAHAGWRGTLAGVASALAAAMIDAGARASTLSAWIAPAIGRANYEVSPELIESWRDRFGDDADDLHDGRYLDLPATNRRQLLEGGLDARAIEVARECTFADSERFFSYRRDGSCGGHLVTGVVRIT